jgi:peptidoglycan hydrolase-like protein with peptidoglycan-binding domain
MTTTIKCPTSKPTLQLGSKGQAVRDMQAIVNQRLVQFDVLSTPALQIAVDGDFGSETQNAVKYLQCLAFLAIDGIVGSKTWAFLCDGTASLPVLRINSTGNTVKLVQKALKDSGYYTGAIDGIFGSQTDKVVRNFQASNSLTVDGVIGRNTWAALIKSNPHSSICYADIYPAC